MHVQRKNVILGNYWIDFSNETIALKKNNVQYNIYVLSVCQNIVLKCVRKYEKINLQKMLYPNSKGIKNIFKNWEKNMIFYL